MRIPTHGTAVASAVVCLLASQHVIAAQPWYELQLLLPSGSNGQVTTQLTGGWPLVVRATAPKGAPTYDLDGYGSYAVVASDPGGCFSSSDPRTCLLLPPEEVYTRLWVDLDTAGSRDVKGDPGISLALVDSAGGGGAVFRGIALDGSPTFVTTGPDTGGEIRDGFGYGANDDWPQLVLLSKHGVGVVLDEYFNRGPVEQRRNLAGFLTWSTYDLADEKGSSVVSSGMIVPSGLFSPLIKLDEVVGQPDAGGQSSANFLFRVDGGPVQTGITRCLSGQYGAILYGMDYELRAFLVSGPAPSVLSDMDGDGDVDAADAELSGLNVISTERTVHFRIWQGGSGASNAFVEDKANRIDADLDGNGSAFNRACREGDVGPGRIQPPPK